MNALRVIESVHGHLGILAVAILIHPAILLRRGRVLSLGLRLSVLFALGMTLLAFGLGISIYGDYRAEVRRELFLRDAAVGYLFETKEHLTFMVLALVVGASIAALVAPREARDLRRAAAATFAAAALLALAVASLGTWVAAVHGFPE